jgi:hypothetical protein
MINMFAKDLGVAATPQFGGGTVFRSGSLLAPFQCGIDDLLTPQQRELLGLVPHKVDPNYHPGFTKLWAKLDMDHNYSGMANLLIRGGYDRAEDVIRCGQFGFRCLDRLLCPRCCWNLGRRITEEYENSFCQENELYFLVTSLSANPDERFRLVCQYLPDHEFLGAKPSVFQESAIVDNYGVPFADFDDLRQARILFQFYTDVICS